METRKTKFGFGLIFLAGPLGGSEEFCRPERVSVDFSLRKCKRTDSEAFVLSTRAGGGPESARPQKMFRLLVLCSIAYETVLGSSPRFSNVKSASSAASDPMINLQIFRQCVNNKDIFNISIIAKTAAPFVPLQPPIFKQKLSETKFREALYKKRILPMLSAAEVS
jgi:hypothetical protein